MNSPCDVVLRDGTTLQLRALVAEDADALRRFFDGLSSDSIYFRYFGRVASSGLADRTRPTGATPDLHGEVTAVRAVIADALARAPG